MQWVSVRFSRGGRMVTIWQGSQLGCHGGYSMFELDDDEYDNNKLFPWQEKLIAPLDATLKNVAKGTRIGKAKDETTLQSKIN